MSLCNHHFIILIFNFFLIVYNFAQKVKETNQNEHKGIMTSLEKNF